MIDFNNKEILFGYEMIFNVYELELKTSRA